METKLREMNHEIDRKISKLLKHLGIPASLTGYKYLMEGIRYLYEEPKRVVKMVKEFYPYIADKNGTTTSRVERAIRHAIEVAWKRGDFDFREKMFGYSISAEKGKPTNGEFVATVVEYLKIEDVQ